MRAGIMRHRLQVQVFTTVKDAAATPVKVWAPIDGDPDSWVWASIDAPAAREYFGPIPRDVGSVRWRIQMYRMPGVKIDPGMRGIDMDTGAEYDFTAVLPSHDREMFNVEATSGKGAS